MVVSSDLSTGSLKSYAVIFFLLMTVHLLLIFLRIFNILSCLSLQTQLSVLALLSASRRLRYTFIPNQVQILFLHLFNTIGNHPLTYVDKITYLGSILSRNVTIEHDVLSRISKPSNALGKLTRKFRKRHDINLSAKIAVYKAVIVPILLYCCESWTL